MKGLGCRSTQMTLSNRWRVAKNKIPDCQWAQYGKPPRRRVHRVDMAYPACCCCWECDDRIRTDGNCRRRQCQAKMFANAFLCLAAVMMSVMRQSPAADLLLGAALSILGLLLWGSLGIDAWQLGRQSQVEPSP